MTTQKTRELIATDEGTHGHPGTFCLYRLPGGSYQLCVYFGGGLIRDETTARRPRLPATKGRVRWFNGVPR